MPERDRHIQRSGDDYTSAFSQSLPQGIAWPRAATSVLMRLVKGLSKFWGEVDKAAALLLELESDPRSTTALLPEWERAWGLPDPCYYDPNNPQTIGERRVALVQRITIQGAQSRQFFIEQSAYIGYKITITEYRPFMVGIDRVGDNRIIGDGTPNQKNEFGLPVYGLYGKPIIRGETSEYPYILGQPENRFYWTVHVGQVRLTWFRVGLGGGQTGVDPHLRIATALDLECLLNRWKPAHTEIIFDYSGLEAPGPFTGTGSGDWISPGGNVVLSTTAPTIKNPSTFIGNLVLSSTAPTVVKTGGGAGGTFIDDISEIAFIDDLSEIVFTSDP